ncbi:MAG: helix-turn-helix transcriptional regulator [Clostridia bacterium]|nr:helix-turn-helix transcriptional regulator [Clostridia bacterium]
MNTDLGKNIRALRLRDGRTQEDLAAALGVSPQAVSRWETMTCYPDMELLPSIANAFGVSIDELFGYGGERERIISEKIRRIRELNADNNGKDVSMDECLRLAREAAAEFPGTPEITLTLAHVLYNEGYVKRGEYHVMDTEGFDQYDTDLHRTYPEWREAILLYEKLLPLLPDDKSRHEAVGNLIQLYANTGEYDRAETIAKDRPPLEGCREWLLASAHDGKQRADFLGKLLIRLVSSAADQMIQLYLASCQNTEPGFAADVIRRALALYDPLFPDGDCGGCHEGIARLYLFLSEFQCRLGDMDGAFASLDLALEHAKEFDRWARSEDAPYSSLLFRYVTRNSKSRVPADERFAPDLPEVWPWWQVPDFDGAKSALAADPRWDDWVRRCRES